MQKVVYFGTNNITGQMIVEGLDPIKDNVIHAQEINELEKVLIDLKDTPKILVMDMREDRTYGIAIGDIVKGTQERYDFIQSNPVVMISTFGEHSEGFGVVGTVTSMQALPNGYSGTSHDAPKPQASILCNILQKVMGQENILTPKNFEKAKKDVLNATTERRRVRQFSITS